MQKKNITCRYGLNRRYEVQFNVMTSETSTVVQSVVFKTIDSAKVFVKYKALDEIKFIMRTECRQICSLYFLRI